MGSALGSVVEVNGQRYTIREEWASAGDFLRFSLLFLSWIGQLVRTWQEIEDFLHVFTELTSVEGKSVRV